MMLARRMAICPVRGDPAVERAACRESPTESALWPGSAAAT